MFNLLKFVETAVQNASALIPIVIAIGTLLGRFGLEGKAQLGATIGVGFALAASAQIAELGVPVDFPGWFAVLIFGLIVPLSAVGVYETGKSLAGRVAEAVADPTPKGRG